VTTVVINQLPPVGGPAQDDRRPERIWPPDRPAARKGTDDMTTVFVLCTPQPTTPLRPRSH